MHAAPWTGEVAEALLLVLGCWESACRRRVWSSQRLRSRVDPPAGRHNDDDGVMLRVLVLVVLFVHVVLVVRGRPRTAGRRLPAKGLAITKAAFTG